MARYQLSKYLFVLLFCVLFLLNKEGNAQFNNERRDAVKFNVVGPFTSLYSAQYEKSVSKSISFLLTGFYRPLKQIPFGTELDKLAKSRGLGITGVNFEYIFVNEAKIGVLGASPEVRFYLGKKKNRTFISLFGQYEDFDLNVPASLLVNFRGVDAEIITPIEFDIQTLSGGLLIGKQFRFGRFGVDAVIIGPHVGRANNVSAEVSQSLLSQLNADERALLKQRIIERFGIDETYYQTDIADAKASIASKRNVPYLGIRGAGLNLAYYF